MVRVDPKTGAVKPLAKGDGLAAPHGIALEPGGPAYVADFKARAVIRVAQTPSGWKASSFKKGPFAAPEGIAGVLLTPLGLAPSADGKTLYIGSTGGLPGTAVSPNGVATAVSSPQQPLAATVAVSVNVPGGFRPSASASKAVRVKTVTKAIPAGVRTKVRVPFKPALRKQIKAALKAGKKVKAKVTVTATAGNGSTRKVVKRASIKSSR